jgi:hypothetical protein
MNLDNFLAMEAPMRSKMEPPSRVVPLPSSASTPKQGEVQVPTINLTGQTPGGGGGSTPSAQPTTRDVLHAIQQLSNMISQLGKNQKVLESRLSSIADTVEANHANIIKSANYGVSWQIGLWNLNNGTPTPNPTVNWS